MGLFSSLVFNNGTDHTFIEVGQIPDTKSIIRKYIETGVSQALKSFFLVKQDLSSKTLRRGLLQRSKLVAGTDGVLYPITVNFTVTCNQKHADADVILEQKLLADAIADTTFHTNFAAGLS